MKTSLPLKDMPLYNLDDIKAGKCVYYTTLYNGTYKSGDFEENVGSHCGVDFSTSQHGENQPELLAIMSGVVSKADQNHSSYGKCVVIKHENVPDPDDDSKLTTLFSCYMHLSELIVSENENIECGQIIGKTGNTGNSYGAHLHLQLDRIEAPWHPYWPFSWSESKEAGLSFVEAVNTGLGLDNAQKFTVHPYNYIQKYLNGSDDELIKSEGDLVASAGISDSGEVTPGGDLSATDDPVVADTSTDDTDLSVADTSDSSDVIDATTDSSDGDSVVADSSDTTDVDSTDIVDSSDDIDVDASDVDSLDVDSASDDLLVTDDTDVSDPFDSDSVDTSDVDSDAVVDTDTTDVVGDDVSVDDEQIFPDVPLDHPFYASSAYLQKNNIINGYKDGSFGPDDNVTRAQLLKIIMLAFDIELNDDLGDNPFSDITKDDWYTPYILTAVKNGYANGYDDGTFQPNKAVNRAEAFKFICGVNELSAENIDDMTFEDVPDDTWFTGFAAIAQEKKLLDFENNLFEGSKILSRGETSEVIYRLLNSK